MTEEKSKMSRSDWFLYVLACLALGAIIAIPVSLNVIANKLDRIETILFVAEACKAGAKLDACEVLAQ